MKRIVVLDKELCNSKKCGSECKKYCPVNRKGEECVKIFDKAIIDENLCIGCGICVKKCPFKALSVVNLPEALKENPIHRFGINDFALFRLPIPVKGVVGLLGANGLGKTTALEILSGKLEPNLGILESRVNIYDELIKIHRGSELQDYLERLSKNEITTSYKPQNVSLLAELGKYVSDLSIDSDLMKKFDLDEDKKLNELSGGELQRIAIAAAMSKEADVYYFDEPSSFLDVHFRLEVAKAIRALAEKRFVVVVEHDLATLDFLADRIHILYGVPSVFGVVSKPYSVKKGINVFLNGFVAEDNVRIREPIRFDELTREKTKGNVLISFSNIEKNYNGFSLRIDKGEIYEDEVLGIFGPNALGKTTFAKILAGEISFSGNISKKIKISYKPQYISSDFDGSVYELLSLIREKEKGLNFNLIVQKLNLEKLLEKKVKNLSGGELQRVAIASCLLRNSDLYLLDEPSAFLDVDQRLNVAKLLRMVGTVAVIDHDLLFLSYVSDRAMLFHGEPAKFGFAEFLSLRDGFNKFLKGCDISFRRDEETKRPRANKPDSKKDREQKEKGEYFY